MPHQLCTNCAKKNDDDHSIINYRVLHTVGTDVPFVSGYSNISRMNINDHKTIFNNSTSFACIRVLCTSIDYNVANILNGNNQRIDIIKKTHISASSQFVSVYCEWCTTDFFFVIVRARVRNMKMNVMLL